MTHEWGGAQWLLAAYLMAVTAGPPIFRWVVLAEKPEVVDALSRPRAAKTWTEFWHDWWGRVIMRMLLVLMLRWGGFW
jgi:hypothetical protein